MAKIDNEDELKRQMRRRLVGAVALVTAMVVILPMVLESSPRRSDQGIELRIPDKDKAGAFTTQMVVPESAPEVSPEPVPASEPVAAPASAVPAEAAKPPKAEPEHKVEPAKPATAQHSQTKPAPAKPAPAKPEHKAVESAQAPKAGFAVQVGAYANAATAKELRDKLQKQGWHAYTGKAGETVRVRVGPYRSREDAERALHKLEGQGMHPAVVNEP